MGYEDTLNRHAASHPPSASHRPVSGSLWDVPATSAAFDALFDSSGEALVVVDSAGVIHRANRKSLELLRLNAENSRRTSLRDCLPQMPTGQLAALSAAATASPSFDSTLASGFRVRITLRAVLPGPHNLLLCLEGDLRSQGAEGKSHEPEADLHSILERPIQSKMLQTEKMAALGQLVSGIAHELNNPLTAILGYTQLLLGRGLGPGPLSEARKVYHEAERARRIVKNLLYFARENRTERTRVDLNEIIERTLALRSYEMKVENIVVDCELAPDLPRTMADPYQLQQVVLNLVINAEQALLEGRGQGRVWIRTQHLPHARGDRISLEISDDGPGIPHDIAGRVFDPFFTTKPAGVGTGLGLSIVYGIVHQHGGEVAFASQPGSGAKFTVELPVISAAGEEREDMSPEDAGAAQAVVTGRILVVEDEPTVAQLIADVLREEGHQVEAVLDSQEGLTRLSRSRYDLVVCDLRMPRLDGPAFYEALVRGGSPMQRRIIFVTGDTAAPRTPEFLARYDLPYLAKPFLVEELKLAVQRAFERARRPEKADDEAGDASLRPMSRSAEGAA